MTQTKVKDRAEEKIKQSKSESKGYILTIDDDDHIRSIFASYLENFGYQIKMAKDGNEAKTLLEKTNSTSRFWIFVYLTIMALIS